MHEGKRIYKSIRNCTKMTDLDLNQIEEKSIIYYCKIINYYKIIRFINNYKIINGHLVSKQLSK